LRWNENEDNGDRAVERIRAEERKSEFTRTTEERGLKERKDAVAGLENPPGFWACKINIESEALRTTGWLLYLLNHKFKK
jgi:hypothetical protein